MQAMHPRGLGPYPHSQVHAQPHLYAMGYLLQIISVKYKKTSLLPLILCVSLLVHVDTYTCMLSRFFHTF